MENNSMTVMGGFKKVSREQFSKDFTKMAAKHSAISSPLTILVDKMYDQIKLPERATRCSAGYDFFMPRCDDIVTVSLHNGESVVIPTGIKCKLPQKFSLNLYPRSGLGFKYGLQLLNTVGIIDADYYNNPDNEGHIMIAIKVTNLPEGETLNIKSGDAFAQGIITPYFIFNNDSANGLRVGGMGSTSN